MISTNEGELKCLRVELDGAEYALKIRPFGNTGLSLDGNLVDSLFGAPHWEIIEFYQPGNDNPFLLARHKEEGRQAFYSKDGDSTLFGGPHHFVADYAHVNGVDYVVAKHNPDAKSLLYEKNGSISSAFGCPHLYISRFQEIQGHIFLYATGLNDSNFNYYTLSGGRIANNLQDIGDMVSYMDVFEPYGLFRAYTEAKDAIKNYRPYRERMYNADRQKLREAFDSSLDVIQKRYEVDPEMQKRAFTHFFSTLHRWIIEEPEKLMDLMRANI